MPSLPEKILGHEKQRGQLLQDIAKGNVAHAYLLAGPKHLGKFTVARWFAAQLLSDSVPADERSTVREKIERMIHPDFLSLDQLWIEGVMEDWAMISQTSNVPQQHRAKETTAKSDSISIDDIRELSARLHATGDSPYLCCIIRSVERMPAAAATSFLKILEEPPKRVVFLLTTEDLPALLPTLVSRTRTMHFRPLPAVQMRTLLTTADDEEAGLALHLAQGAPGALIRLQQDPEELRLSKQLHAQAKQFWQTKSIKDRLAWLMPFGTSEKTELPEVIRHLGLTLREHPDKTLCPERSKAYMELIRGLQTNAHKGLLLEQFTLAVGVASC